MNIQAQTLEPGTSVGELEILRVVGTGAYSVTYQVNDTALGTALVLKEHFPALHASRQADGQVQPKNDQSRQEFSAGLERFLAEGRRLAAIDHPGIIGVLRYFEANGTAYLVMPWHQGETLAQTLKNKGNLDRQQAHDLLLPLLDTLDYLHQQKLYHLDIKPANIYITESGAPLLLDFGAAVSGQELETGAGSGQGSQGYAAPEQSDARGEIGSWTDIYGLAATLYRCITGQLPAVARHRLEEVNAGNPDPLATLSGIVDAEDFGGLIDLVEHGLELDIKARPQSAEQWRKSFESLDWRQRVAGKTSSEYAAEDREWLPIILLSVFLLTMGAVAVYLLTDHDPGVNPAVVGEDIDLPVPDPDRHAHEEVSKDQPPPTVSTEESNRWQAALQANTVLGYQRFMADFPESIYLQQAQLQLDIIDDRTWQALAEENTRKAFEDYLDEFPNGRHQAEAMVRIDEIDKALAQAEREHLERERLDHAAWNEASQARTTDAVARYINDWPAGLHIDEANQLHRQLLDHANDNKAFELARQLDTRDAWQAYIDAFPRGEKVTEALQMIDMLTFRPGKTFRDCSVCPEMVVVAAGSYQQGADEGSDLALANEKPRRTVTIPQQFAVGIHEVTLDEWDACFDDQGCSLRPDDNGWGRGSRPVIMVSWNDAQEYIQWLNQKTGQAYRLPSESEWEYFARAGEKSDWLGGEAARVCAYANVAGSETGFRWQHDACADQQNLGTLPAGSMQANAFGLFDVIGNVSEWTSDCMNLSYLDAPVDGSAWGRGICSSHMTRGGSWVTGTNEIRLPARFNLKNGDRNDFTGFRVVRPVEK